MHTSHVILQVANRPTKPDTHGGGMKHNEKGVNKTNTQQIDAVVASWAQGKKSKKLQLYFQAKKNLVSCRCFHTSM